MILNLRGNYYRNRCEENRDYTSNLIELITGILYIAAVSMHSIVVVHWNVNKCIENLLKKVYKMQTL